MTLELPEISSLSRFTAEDLRLELACSFYAREQLSAVAGAELAGISLFAFQAALRDRGIPRQYSEDDLKEDVESLHKLLTA